MKCSIINNTLKNTVFIIFLSMISNTMANLKTFLRQSNTFIRNFPSSSDISNVQIPPIGNSKIILCLGNEAADADSIISSLCYAYWRTQKRVSLPESIRSTDCGSAINHIYLPIVNIDRTELHLRRDVDLLLQYYDISLQDLNCLSDIVQWNFSKLVENEKLGIILLDHNILSMRWQKLLNHIDMTKYPCVDEILDHHIDMKEYLVCKSRNVAFNNDDSLPLVGSTCTLVAEEVLKDGTPISETIFNSIGLLLKGVISLDTFNMDPLMGKGTKRDERILRLLDKNINSASVTRESLFYLLVNAKNDINFWRSLTCKEALLLDFKDFQFKFSNNDATHVVIGISSVLLPIEELLMKPDACDVIKEYLHSEREMLILMALISHPGKPTYRQLFLVSKDSQRISDICEYIHDNANNLQLKSLDFNFNCQYFWRSYVQENVKVSRKQLAVILQSYYLTLN